MTQRKQTTVRFGRKFVRAGSGGEAAAGAGAGAVAGSAEIARMSNLLERCQRSLEADIYLPCSLSSVVIMLSVMYRF